MAKVLNKDVWDLGSIASSWDFLSHLLVAWPNYQVFRLVVFSNLFNLFHST